MNFRKSMALVLTVVLALSISLPAWAATGYGPGTTTTSSSSSSSSRSRSGSSYVAFSGYTPSSVSRTTSDSWSSSSARQVTTSIERSLKNVSSAKAAVSNVGVLSVSSLQDVFSKAPQAGRELKLMFDRRGADNKIESRVYLDKETLSQLSGKVDFSVLVSREATEKATSKFSKYFSNQFAAVHFGQKGAFGANIRVAVKLDLSSLDTDNLVFYGYDVDSNKYTLLPINAYRVDKNGYLHFATPVGGDLIISDRPITSK